jgi:hypothetical protein
MDRGGTEHFPPAIPGLPRRLALGRHQGMHSPFPSPPSPAFGLAIYYYIYIYIYIYIERERERERERETQNYIIHTPSSKIGSSLSSARLEEGTRERL